jgi:hypothetical protein
MTPHLTRVRHGVPDGFGVLLDKKKGITHSLSPEKNGSSIRVSLAVASHLPMSRNRDHEYVKHLDSEADALQVWNAVDQAKTAWIALVDGW